MSDGRILQVLGAVVDVEFPPGKLPEVFNALTISNPAIDAVFTTWASVPRSIRRGTNDRMTCRMP